MKSFIEIVKRLWFVILIMALFIVMMVMLTLS
jgi:hypothetical protein